jgi:crotonobetainyl-CoA:carnitine CoA-transferase CaiB-like acyl-CoA transferase
MSLTGGSDGPPYRLGVAVVDIVAGLFAAQGILLALIARGQTGRGQHVDVAMLDSVAALLTYQAGIVFATGQPPARMGNRHPSIAPYDVFETSDGPLVLAVGNDDQWQRFCRVTGLTALGDDPRFTTNESRVKHYAALEAPVAAILRTRPRAAWTSELVAAGVPCGPVRPVDEVLADPQLTARAMLASLPHPLAGQVAMLGLPVKLSDTPGGLRVAPPTLGQHTDAVLAEIGLDVAQIAEMRRHGAV